MKEEIFKDKFKMTFNDYYNKYYKSIVNYYSYIYTDKELLETCINDSFMKFLDKIEDVDMDNNPKSYLLTIISNEYLKRKKLEKRNNVYYFDLNEEVSLLIDEEDNHMEDYEERKEFFKSKIYEFGTPLQIMIFEMKCKGMTIKEIAKELNIKECAIKNNLYYKGFKKNKEEKESKDALTIKIRELRDSGLKLNNIRDKLNISMNEVIYHIYNRKIK